MPYPNSLDSFIDPSSAQFLNNPSHSAIEQAQNAALRALESLVGVTGSSVPTTIDYLLTNPLSLDPGHLHTLSAQIGNLPFSRITGGVPSSAITGSFPASSLSGTVSTANLPVGTNAGQILIFPANDILPVANASALTNIPNLSPWTKIQTIAVSASLSNATLTQICSFTGLTGDTDDEYLIEFELNTTQSSNTVGTLLALRLNNDSTASHYMYYNSVITFSGTTTGLDNNSQTQDTMIRLAVGGTNSSLITTFGNIKIKASKTIAGTTRLTLSDVATANSNTRGAGSWFDTTNQITSLQLYFEQSSGSTGTISGLATLYKINR